MTVVVVATRNAGKLAELQSLLRSAAPWELRSVDRYPEVPEIIEDADTFEGNALKKARAVARVTRQWALADDSGLEVDALEGAPGVWSARFAGPTASDADNVAKLLLELKSVPAQQRRARFRCVLVLVCPKKLDARCVSQGTCEGSIAFEPRGTHGFGYDPVFVPEGESRTFGELSAEVKQATSHRAQAAAHLATSMKEL